MQICLQQWLQPVSQSVVCRCGSNRQTVMVGSGRYSNSRLWSETMQSTQGADERSGQMKNERKEDLESKANECWKEVGGRMRFLGEAGFLLTNCGNAQIYCLQLEVALWRRLTPFFRAVKYMSCVSRKEVIWFLSESCLNNHNAFPELDKNQRGEKLKEKRTTCLCQVASGLKPTFSVTCRSQQCSQTIRSFC